MLLCRREHLCEAGEAQNAISGEMERYVEI